MVLSPLGIGAVLCGTGPSIPPMLEALRFFCFFARRVYKNVLDTVVHLVHWLCHFSPIIQGKLSKGRRLVFFTIFSQPTRSRLGACAQPEWSAITRALDTERLLVLVIKSPCVGLPLSETCCKPFLLSLVVLLPFSRVRSLSHDPVS